MVSFFNNSSVKLVAGPVSYTSKTSFFQKFQELEFYSLISSGAGAIGIGKPIFCNAANLAYSRDVIKIFNKVNDSKLASGDDVFLLHNVKAKYPNSVVFAKHPDTIVQTESTKDFRQFINQRKRWVAKSSSYKDKVSVYTSYLVLLTNLSLVLIFLSIFIDFYFFHFFVIFYSSKFIIDFSLLAPTLRFLKRKDLVKWIFFFELFYSFYIILVVVLSFTKEFEWKGRRHKK